MKKKNYWFRNSIDSFVVVTGVDYDDLTYITKYNSYYYIVEKKTCLYVSRHEKKKICIEKYETQNKERLLDLIRNNDNTYIKGCKAYDEFLQNYKSNNM